MVIIIIVIIIIKIIMMIIIHITMKITQDTSITGDSIVKNVNGYLLTKKLRNKKLIKFVQWSQSKLYI